VLERALRPLIDPGFLRIVTGGAEVGGELINDPRVAAVHMTGAAATHDAIVFGTGDEGAANKAAGRKLLDKPVTSELGGISPTIVLPGRWSAADLRYQAEHVATQKLHNSGFNCVASQVVIVSSDWEQKDDFLAERSVVRGPFRPAPRSVLHGELALSPKPPWFVTNRTAATTGRRLTSFTADPSWSALPGIFASALRG
jgi:aldehyde dehydrogenase (NAD(P)+)